MSLGLNDNPPLGAFTPEPRHKSAGLAFALSLLIPGAGQFYCGKIGRGAITLSFWLLGLVVCFSGQPQMVGMGLVVMFVLWIFSFLDAYLTATEINRGQDDVVDVQNPRVAVTLNLLTAGFGYFYLGERAKGITLFVVMQVSRLLFARVGGFAGGVISAALVILQLLMAADAYRIARRQLREAFGSEPAPQAASVVPPSRLPVQVPVALACLLVFGFLLLVAIGLAFGPSRQRKRVAASNAKQPRPVFSNGAVDLYAVPDATPIPAVDLATAAQNVQQVERKPRRLKNEDIPNLKQDVRVLTTFLGKKKIDATDAVVAHYFRGVSLALINNVHFREGEEIDMPAAHQSLADMKQVIGGGSTTAGTYVPEVSVSHAQYWAGSISRNHLRDEKAAYSYWEQCAGAGNAGCTHILAGAHVTGEGGEKVDFANALDLYTSVFNTGIKYRCAGASSAISIARINYFTGVRRPGDDELDWAQKSDDLFDKLEATEHNRNACGRVESVVERFLFQLSRGQRDDNILEDAIGRLDEDSNATKAVIQYISGAIDQAGLEAALQAEKSQGTRCSAYFDAMWYSELRGEEALARHYYQRLVDIGKFHCGQHLVYANKFKL